MQISIKTLIGLRFKDGLDFVVAQEAMSHAMGDKYDDINATYEDVKAVSKKISASLQAQIERAGAPDQEGFADVFGTTTQEERDEQIMRITRVESAIYDMFANIRNSYL
jgi:hypothetical protein